MLLLLTGCAVKHPAQSYVTHSGWGYVVHCPNGEAGWWPTRPDTEDVKFACGEWRAEMEQVEMEKVKVQQ